MTLPAGKPSAVIWDFDGTILPFDSEQALLLSLSSEPERKVGRINAWLGRGLAWADRHGVLQRSFKRLYARCLRGLPVEELDALAHTLAEHIPDEDRQAIREAHDLGAPMMVVSCGTGDLSQRVLMAAGLAGCFVSIEANWFTYREHCIEGMAPVIHAPEDKLKAVAGLGIDLANAIAIGDGITDVPVLDRARHPILLDRNGKRADLIARKGYLGARSLAEMTWLLVELVE